MLPLRSLLFRSVKRPHVRWYTDSPPTPPKASVKLLAELRKRTEVSISRAKDALVATDNDVEAALQWLRNDLANTGAKKAEKVRDRTAKEGLISVSLLNSGVDDASGPKPIRAAMIELNCETDFVARNKLFVDLARDVAYTAAYFSFDGWHEPVFQEQEVDGVLKAPLLSQGSTEAGDVTVEDAIRNTIVHVGENITLRRSASVSLDDTLKDFLPDLVAYRMASYVHGTTPAGPSQGRIGALAFTSLHLFELMKLLKEPAFMEEFRQLERSLMRQIVGFETLRISNMYGGAPVPEEALYDQPFAMLAGGSTDKRVSEVLDAWSKEKLKQYAPDAKGKLYVNVDVFKKWTVGEDIPDINVEGDEYRWVSPDEDLKPWKYAKPS